MLKYSKKQLRNSMHVGNLFSSFNGISKNGIIGKNGRH